MYSLNDFIDLLPQDSKISGNKEAGFDNVCPVLEANETSLIWIKAKSHSEDLLSISPASIIICPDTFHLQSGDYPEKLIIQHNNPKLIFIRIATKLFASSVKPGIHPAAIIDQKASFGKNVYIGPNTVIEECIVGDDVVIHGNCYLFKGVIIGDRVVINPGTVIGADGFGYSRNEEGQIEKFPHFGGVIIENDVEIGSNTSIDKGTLGNTIIGEGVKIDNLVHIAHNVKIGKHSLIIANSMIGGSTEIGEYSWVAPSASLMNGITIGKWSTVGLGAVVVKNCPENETWTGSPARPLKEIIELNKKLKSLCSEKES